MHTRSAGPKTFMRFKKMSHLGPQQPTDNFSELLPPTPLAECPVTVLAGFVGHAVLEGMHSSDIPWVKASP